VLRALLLVVVLASSASAEPVRSDRKVLVAITIPDWMYITSHDVTFPLPGLHVGYQAHRRVLAEVGVAFMPLPYGASAALAHAGARYLFRESRWSPYALGRVGAYTSDPDEGDGGTWPFVVTGLGMELAATGGFAAWLEAGVGLVSFENLDRRETNAAVWISVGAGYRF
jgi:hypothetical protein